MPRLVENNSLTDNSVTENKKKVKKNSDRDYSNIRKYLQNRNQTENDAPGFYSYFEKRLDEKDLTG